MKLKVIKGILIFVIALPVFQSCGFIFYSYRGYINSSFSIPNATNDTTIRYKVGRLIYQQSFLSKLYTRFSTKTFDSLYFYGPDYHTLRFKITEQQGTTKIHFTYFGYNGWRGRPPHKLFITAVRDSLKNNYRATELIHKEISNEKKKKDTTEKG